MCILFYFEEPFCPPHAYVVDVCDVNSSRDIADVVDIFNGSSVSVVADAQFLVELARCLLTLLD